MSRAWISPGPATLAVVVATTVLLFAPTAAAVRPPADHDVADYLAFVAYMGPTAHPCWRYEGGGRPNALPGIMFARLHKDARIYHGTVDGSWAPKSSIRPNAFYGTSALYPTLHVLGRSYFVGGVMPSNFKKAPQVLKDPKILEYEIANAQDLHLYAYDFFPENFVSAWKEVDRTAGKPVKSYYDAEIKKPGVKSNIAGVEAISKYWGDQFKIPIRGFIQRRTVQGPDFVILAKGVVGRTSGAADLGKVDGKPYFVKKSEKFGPLLDNDRILLYDEVVYFATPAYKRSSPISDPKDRPDAIADHVGAWLDACEAAAAAGTVLPYTLDYMTYWPWNNNRQAFDGRDQKFAVHELLDLDLRALRQWNKTLLEKLQADVLAGAGKKEGLRAQLDLYVVLALRSGEGAALMRSADVAQIRVLSYDLLLKYCSRPSVNAYHVCTLREVTKAPLDVGGALKVKRDKGELDAADVLGPGGALNAWLF